MPFRSLASLVLLTLPLAAQTAKTVDIFVKEPAGIRRTAFPVNLRIPFPKGALDDAAHARLLFNKMEVPVECTAEARWPDGSVQWLDVDLNSTIGPLESQTYQLEYGPEIKVAATPRGHAVREDADAIQVGPMRFSKSGAPLQLSVKYRAEAIASGENGVSVTGGNGKSHDLAGAEGLKVEILRHGPLYVVIRYTGRLPIDSGYGAPFDVRVEMPNSKAWVKIDAKVQDPGRRLRDISVHTPLALGAFPWVWDFGTERWTYGAIRKAGDSVVLTQVTKTPGMAEWNVMAGPKGQEQLYDTARSALARWGHIQDAKEAVAFAVETSPRQLGTYRFSAEGSGQLSFRFTPAAPAAEHRLTVYEHFVTTPVHIGAATSPSSILNPLVATCDRRQYALAGVAPPR